MPFLLKKFTKSFLLSSCHLITIKNQNILIQGLEVLKEPPKLTFVHQSFDSIFIF